jgi:Mn2+/Fe2+ NRAMP family transporter
LIGTGILAIPVLAGSSAYAIGEALAWRASLDLRPPLARKFYSVVAVSLALGMALDYLGINANAVKMLFWSAVINGVLAPPLIVLVIVLTSDARVMGEHKNSKLMRWLGWISVAAMTAAAVAMFIA